MVMILLVIIIIIVIGVSLINDNWFIYLNLYNVALGISPPLLHSLIL